MFLDILAILLVVAGVAFGLWKGLLTQVVVLVGLYLGALLARFEKADAAFQRDLCDVRNRNAWSDTFVDALCEPPETFTFGGMFAHVVTFNTYRRLTALGALRSFGVKVEGFGCPMEYEAAVTPRGNGA